MNTEIQYRYRDLDNYKEHRRVVFAGEITPEQRRTIMSGLDEEEFFLPMQLDLEPVLFDDGDDGAHPWHELVSITLTDHSPTESESIAAFAQRFDGIVWDEPGDDQTAQTVVKVWMESDGTYTVEAPDGVIVKVRWVHKDDEATCQCGFVIRSNEDREWYHVHAPEIWGGDHDPDPN